MDIPHKDSSSTRTLRRALATFKSLEHFAIALGVEPEELRLWIDGGQSPPHEVFKKALDLAFSSTVPPTARVIPAHKIPKTPPE
jgi:hypothetical protein